MLGFASVQAQNGTIRGTVTDSETGELLMFANVIIQDTDPPIGTQTDLDGAYELSSPAGIIAVEVSYVGYSNKVITDIEVKDGEVTVIDIALGEDALDLEEIVVKAERLDRTENALLALQRKAPGIQDGISAQEISRYGSSNAAESMKRVTGASVVDGKYVYVRGLGDRYSSAQLNGQELPSTDPYRNSSQLDLIPANLLENIIASKSFTPDQPGSFTGGNVNIKTKSFPERFTLSFSSGVTYNTISSFQDDFLSYNGGSNDWLGFDDGTREIPSVIIDPKNREELTDGLNVRARSDESLANILDVTSNSVNPEMAPITDNSGINHSLAFSVGNQFDVGGHPLGLLAGVNYRRSFSAYGMDEGISSYYELIADSNSPNGFSMNEQFNYVTSRGTDNPQIGGLFNLAYKFGASNTNKVSFNFLYNHDAEKSAAFGTGPNPDLLTGTNELESRVLSWKEREMSSLQLTGEHVLSFLNNAVLEWGGSIVNSNQIEPDLRFFANSFRDNSDGTRNHFINPSQVDLPFHMWRTLDDQQQLGKADLTIPFLQSRSKGNKFKIGYLYKNKDRNFEELRYQFQNKDSNTESYQGDPLTFFGPENVGIVRVDTTGSGNLRYRSGLFLSDETRPENRYIGQEEVTAYYAMGTYDLNKLRIIAGARVEETNIVVNSIDTGRINATDVLPSLSLTYRASENMNFRAGASQTLARPNLREIAPFSSFEFIGGFIFTGNPEIERTLVQNYDLRWEWFPNAGELIAISAYYKNFENPIVSRFIPESLNAEVKFDNEESGRVYGVELELRKSLAFIADALRNFKFSTNLSFIQSEVDINAEELAVIQRNPEFGDTRPFPGQSDILFNAALNYQNLENGLDAILSFNYFSERLAIIGRNGTPDIYEQPRPQLDFSIKKTFQENFQAKFSVQNILDTNYRTSMSFGGEEYVVIEYPRGLSFGLSLSYTIR
jgi:outer membrane receptor protein involved in Fe transport